jgi:hypothetical protein
MENNYSEKQLDHILQNSEEEEKYTSSVIEETLKRAKMDESYRINNKDYLEELEKLDRILKEYPQLLTPVETLIKDINELDSKENGKYWYMFKASMIRPIRKYLEVLKKEDLSQQEYQKKINDLYKAILYLSSVSYLLYTKYYLKEVWENFTRPYLTLEDSIKEISNKLEEEIIYLLKDFEWFKEKYFEKLIHN